MELLNVDYLEWVSVPLNQREGAKRWSHTLSLPRGAMVEAMGW